MKKTIVLSILILALAISACGSPQVSDVAQKCDLEHKTQGQSVTLGGVEYACPVPTVIPTPLNNLANALVGATEALCKANSDAWKDSSNAKWLAENITKPEEYWHYQNGNWVYVYEREFISLTFGGYSQVYQTAFKYPGFGTLTVTLYDVAFAKEAGTTVVDSPRDKVYLNFTKLVLTCP